MGNLHCVAASAVSVTTTTETVLATMTPINENEVSGAQSGALQTGVTPAPGPQGVYLGGSINFTTGAGTTAVVIRIRQGSLTGPLVGVAQTVAVAASSTVALDIGELDPTFVENGMTYVVTVQQTGASGNGTANRVVFTAETANSFE